MILQTKNLTKTFGGLTAIDSLNITVNKGEIVSLIGPNGAGKTTFFNCVTGIYLPIKGDVIFDNKKINGLKPNEISKIGIARTFQNIRLFPEMTALENVMVSGDKKEPAGIKEAIFRGKDSIKKEREMTATALGLLNFVGIRKKASHWARNLSYGDQRRLEIARAMAGEPSLILLDEPAAGMNLNETESLNKLIRLIRDKGITILLIEHDMKVVMGISDRIFVLDHGVLIAEGLPQEIRRDKKVIEAYLGREYA